MFDRFVIVFLGLSVAGSAVAGGFPNPLVMTGITQMSDAVELQFDAVPANTGKLVILGDHTKTPQQIFPFSYTRDMQPDTSVPTVHIVFKDKQALHISCDPYSDNCRSSGYVTEGNATFSMLWQIVHHNGPGNSTTQIHGVASRP